MSAALLSLLATTAVAQTAPAPAPRSPDTVADVPVIGQRRAQRSAIDRQIYTISRDLVAEGGSVSDALRNLPSVAVDVDGSVSLRGDANVQILVDGKPAIQFSGANRAQALQQMAAGGFEAIEVMTNPSAEFPPDGTAGIINLVTKKAKKPGLNGSVQASAGSLGRWGLAATGSLVDGPLSATGALRLRREAQWVLGGAQTSQIDPATGVHTDLVQSGGAQSNVVIVDLSGGVDYDLTARDRLSISGSVLGNDGYRSGTTAEVRRDGSGKVISDLTGLDTEPYTYVVRQGGASWRRTFAPPGRLFTLGLRISSVSEDHRDRLAYDYPTLGQTRVEQRDTLAWSDGGTLSAAYTHPTADGGTLKAGYDLSRQRTISDFRGALIQSDGSRLPMSDVNNRFVFAQTVHQPYATWQKPFGKLTALAGLRLEAASVTYDQQTQGIAGTHDYVDVHPSLHLQYPLGEMQKLTLSYSHRVTRPSPYQLNPFVRYTDTFNATAGNPDLEPQESHSVELQWERQGALTLSAATYLRANYNVIGNVDRFLTPTVLLRTYENQGTATSAGLDLNLSGKFADNLSFRLNATGAYSQVQSPSLAGGETRDAFGYGAKGNLDWQATEADLFQLTGSWTGRQITATGWREATGVVHLGYRRKLRPDLTLTATVSDLFATSRRVSITDTPYLASRNVTEGLPRTIMLTVTRQLGGKPARDQGFEYVN